MIPVNEPVLARESKENVARCLESGWISAAGPFVAEFEESFAQYLGVKHGIAVANGTVALHLALAALAVGPEDEIIMPDLTIISCALAALYLGAKPVLVDVDPRHGNLDPELLEAKINKHTKAIMVVHLYGHPAEMAAIQAVADRYGLPVIEDAAEAHGAEYRGQKVGGLGQLACFSFYANKIITTGEGGMVVTNDDQLAAEVRLRRDLAHAPGKRFWHEKIGYNYRLTSLQAALGVGELQHIEEYLARKQEMARHYNELLAGLPLELPTTSPEVRDVYWMYHVRLLAEAGVTRQQFMDRLQEQGVDTRTFFYPLHQQPVLHGQSGTDQDYPVSSDLAQRGLYLPSGLALTAAQREQVALAIQSVLGK